MNYFTSFKKSITGISLPETFTFPFYYEPHILAELATEELQEYLIYQTEINHSFGLKKETHEIGKMFGVLVVTNQKKEIGYLSAFSGNIENQQKLNRFVPPIYDILATNSFFKVANEELIALSEEIKNLETSEKHLALQKVVLANNKEVSTLISIEREKLKLRKQHRKIRKQQVLSDEFLEQLKNESLHDKFYLKELICYYEDKFIKQQETLNTHNKTISDLKMLRNNKSNALHQKIFDQYQFLNITNKEKSLTAIFNELNLQAPAGTGDCAAPKLLQYAFLHNLKPIALAEFWWGKSGNSSIRKHKNFYPSCNGKCKPLLTHMLDGIVLDKNPLLLNLAKNKKIKIIFEDDEMLVINKPTELLSVPGKSVTDSVYSRLAKKYPKSVNFLIIHRLDMSTSGIMLIAKTKKANQFLQKQFITRTIKKQYIALLDGLIHNNQGEIDLPLRVDLYDRPKQLVCFEYGKIAKTIWKVLERKNNKTLIQFTPITGRTHQLRVHAAHILGLNTAIVGDDLYGKKNNRLHLHAKYIQFIHPKTKEVMEFVTKENF